MTQLVYLEKDSKEMIKALNNLQHCNGVYYKQGTVIGYSWLLDRATVQKLLKKGQISAKNLI